MLDLPGAAEHARLTEQWLKGEIAIPEIEDKWRAGPAVPIEIVLPESISPGDQVTVQTVMTNNKPGHEFPTGPIDIIQSWVDIEVFDQDGNAVFRSGEVDQAHFVEPGSFVFKVEPVDQYGNLIDRHNLWELVGVRYRRSLFAGMSDRAEFSFRVPSHGVDSLRVTAKLMYRKVNQALLNILFGEDAGVTAPISLISEDEIVVPVRPAGMR